MTAVNKLVALATISTGEREIFYWGKTEKTQKTKDTIF